MDIDIDCDILPGSINTVIGHPETNEGNQVSRIQEVQENQEQSGSEKACPANLHDTGKELQEHNISAQQMTALLSTELQTYEAWTIIHHRNGKGGTKQASNGSNEPKVGPKDPKVWPKGGPKGGKEIRSKHEIGSQLIK
jgi:hypothetical protein